MWNGDINDTKEVVIYINLELAKGRTLKDIEINDFKVNDRVIAKRLSRKGYKRIDNKFILINTDEVKHTKVIVKKKTEAVKQVDKVKIYDDSITKVITNKKLEKNLMDLLINYDRIMKVINQYDNQYDKEYDKQYDKQYDNGDNRITIELPIETKSDFRTTIRVNNVIWEQFNEFSSKHSEFTKRDLISMALKCYMDQFK